MVHRSVADCIHVHISVLICQSIYTGLDAAACVARILAGSSLGRLSEHPKTLARPRGPHALFIEASGKFQREGSATDTQRIAVPPETQRK